MLQLGGWLMTVINLPLMMASGWLPLVCTGRQGHRCCQR
jgi:hypothetical protein